MNPQDETQDTAKTSAYNPFPEPQTIPSGWDLSELTFTSQNDSQMDKENATES